jgi:hypothetical protein
MEPYRYSERDHNSMNNTGEKWGFNYYEKLWKSQNKAGDNPTQERSYAFFQSTGCDKVHYAFITLKSSNFQDIIRNFYSMLLLKQRLKIWLLLMLAGTHTKCQMVCL